jgi:DNA-binding MltR family transcriptional regulator
MSKTPPVEPSREFVRGLVPLLAILGNKTHAGEAILSAAILDNELQKVLLSKMRSLSTNKQKLLFDGFGPLSEFAAKIEVAHAFGLINEDVYLDLRTIKSIRDKFAHTPQELNFGSEEIIKLLKNFKDWNSANNSTVFGKKVETCLKHIKERTAAVMSERDA